jgi:hypothetical protein
MISERKYLEAIRSIGVYEIMKSTDHIRSIEEFLANLLVSAAKYNEKNVVSEICSLLLDKNHSSLKHLKEKESLKVKSILHFKDYDDKPAIFYANINNQLLTALDLLYVEKSVHEENRNGAMKCLRQNAGYFGLDQWMLDSYKLIHPSGKWSRRFTAMLMVFFQIMISFFFFFTDWYSDISLCHQYWGIAFDKELNHENATCQKSDNLLSCSYQSAADLRATYTQAFIIMLITIIISSSAFFIVAFQHSPIDFIKNLKSNHCGEGYKKYIVQLVIWFIQFFSKIMWPFTYLIRAFNDRVETDKRGENHQLYESKTTWVFLKSIENGLEGSIQMFLQLYLLKPYVSYLTTMPFSQVIQQGIGSILNFSDSLCDGKNVNIALGKLFLSILSLAHGSSSRRTSKTGITLGQTIKNLVLWLSFICLTLARTIAIFSLVTLEYPLSGIACFISIHLIMMPLVFIDGHGKLWEISKTNSKKPSLQRLKNIGKLMLTCLASHTLVINFQSQDGGNQTFWIQLKFQLIILIENFGLLLLPLLQPNLFPDKDCYKSSWDIVIFTNGLWMVGICLQVKRL